MMVDRRIIALFSVLLAIPHVFAMPVLDRGFELIGSFFDLKILQENPAVQIGFLKIALFIALLAITFAALKKVGSIFDVKTARIVATVFSLIGVFMMPDAWLIATGGSLTALMSSMVFMMIFWGLSYVAVRYMRENWLMNLLGLLLIFLLMGMLDLWTDLIGGRGLPLVGPGAGLNEFIMGIYSQLLSWTQLLLVVLMLVKIIQLAMSFGRGNNDDNGGNNNNGNNNDGDGNNDGNNNNNQLPQVVHGIHVCTEPDDTQPANAGVFRLRLTWNIPDQVATDQRLDNYQVEVRPARMIWGFSPRGTRLTPRVYNVNRSPVILPTDINQNALQGYSRGAHIAVRVRAHNPHGWGPWSHPLPIRVGTNGSFCQGPLPPNDPEDPEHPQPGPGPNPPNDPEDPEHPQPGPGPNPPNDPEDPEHPQPGPGPINQPHFFVTAQSYLINPGFNQRIHFTVNEHDRFVMGEDEQDLPLEPGDNIHIVIETVPGRHFNPDSPSASIMLGDTELLQPNLVFSVLGHGNPVLRNKGTLSNNNKRFEARLVIPDTITDGEHIPQINLETVADE